MKKRILSCFIVMITVLLISAAGEFASYGIVKYKQKKLAQSTDFSLPDDYSYSLKYGYFQKKFTSDEIFRKPVVFGKKHKILIFGCSFAYGGDLEPEQTFSYKLAQKTASTVYNRSFPGWSVSHMLYQINNEKNDLSLKNIPSDIDYVIYVYMEDHIRRVKQFYWGCPFYNIYNLRYKKKRIGNKDILVENKPLIPFIHVFFLTKLFHNYVENNSYFKNKKEYTELFLDILDESHKNLQKRYPNAKFIILSYNTDDLREYETRLNQSGWELYSTFDILDKNINLEYEKYHFRNDSHPSEAAWDEVVKGFTDKNILK